MDWSQTAALRVVAATVCHHHSTALSLSVHNTRKLTAFQLIVVALHCLTPKLSSGQLPRCIYERRERDVQATNNFHPITLSERPPSLCPGRSRCSSLQRKSSLSRLPSIQTQRRLRRNLTINYLVVARPRISEHATASLGRLTSRAYIVQQRQQ